MRSDIDRYKRQAARIDLSGIDFAAFRDNPLPSPVLRCLRYMHDVEHHTVCYLRDLLVTPAHRDSAITTFLTLWNYEEMWHGEAIGQVLAAHGEAEGAQRIAPMRQRLGWRDRLSPVLHSLGSSVAGETFPALHMTWGAINEWTTQAGYSRLSNRAGHPVLTDLLARIMRQEGRHIAFYASEAEARLAAGGRKTERAVRLALRHLWRPVGSGVMPRSEVAFLIGELFGDDEGRAMARRIDERIDRLPGLEGLHLIEGAVERYGATGGRRRSGTSGSEPGSSPQVVDLHAARTLVPGQATAA